MDPLLCKAEYISITFEYQKNDERNESVNIFRTNDPKDFCPVTIAVAIVKRVRAYAGTDNLTNRKICLFKTAKNTWKEITSTAVPKALRAAARCIGEATLGFKLEELGTHSIRSGTAMALYLAKTPTLTIMIIGRWRSEAFLCYIRHQVTQFCENLSPQMIQVDPFFTVPTFNLPSN